jgi:molybdopterin-containing oxidoreductase family membrane subunit
MTVDAGNARLSPRAHWALVAGGAVVLVAGLLAAHAMETQGHAITGLNNQVVWGLPHVFAIFLVVAASGVLNVAHIATVFDRRDYASRAPLSGLLCIALLAGGLAVEVLDLGRPDRVVVALTQHNFTSMFAWNVLLYTGMLTLAGAYLWTVMSRRMGAHARTAGLASFLWRFALTCGTGSIFAFMVARGAYGSALFPPLFIVLSLSWGFAVFLAVDAMVASQRGAAPSADLARRMRRLLGLFVGCGLFLTFVQHLTGAYFARQFAFERFILVDGGIYPLLFWLGYVGAGCLVPLLLAFHPRFDSSRSLAAAAWLVVVGAFAWLYVFVVGGQAWPQDIFPGYAASSSFGDGAIGRYVPSVPELLLGLGGAALAFLITVVGIRVLPFLPKDAPAPAGAVAAGPR